jgi:hypothetical protein
MFVNITGAGVGGKPDICPLDLFGTHNYSRKRKAFA